MTTDVRESFIAATNFLVETVNQIPADKWDSPGLGIWSVRELCAHMSHAFSRIVSFDSPERTADGIDTDNVLDIYMKQIDPAEDSGRGKRAKDDALELGNDPAAEITRRAGAALSMLGNVPDDYPTLSLGGGVRFDHWLETRVVEITVHSLDLANAIAVDVEAPPAALATTLDVLSQLAVATGKSGDLIRAATGRSPLPQGFSLV